MISQTSVQRLKEMISSSNNIVFFGGAGVLTESGIKDFRSADGIYMMDYKYPPESVLSHTFYTKHTEEFFDFYRKYLCFPDAKPNSAHYKLAELEKQGKLKAVITQNVDGLHQRAGSKCVYELHGSALRNYCVKCGKFHDFDFVYRSQGIPECECGGTVKPDVVLYEESLDSDVIEGAVNAIANADMLIVAGTSLTVYPAAGFIRYYSGNNLVLINKDSTEKDDDFGLVIHGKVGEILSKT
ncbi:MAG: NAD-dependent protein deacylase [Clostridia bacterium]|nr:NAD-dependent protein deacylase [Clostridia bacterium]